MIRNEYRRAFIMLRAAIQGYGGHVRLERRTLSGSLYFIVTAPQGVEELRAALVGRQGGEYYAAPVGPLARDRRGQLALAWPFDPRDIQGRPLEAYSWVVVAATGGPCAVALTGNVEGSRPVDPAALSRAVCALFAPDASREDGPSPADAALPQALDDSAFVTRQTRYEPDRTIDEARSEPGDAAEEADRCDVKIYTGSRARRMAAAQSGGSDAPPAGDAASDAPDPGEGAADASAPAYEPPVTAAQRLGLDIAAPWPGDAEPLRRLFATQAPLDAPLGDGFTYVSAPMPEGSGLGLAILGLKTEGGRITAVRHALPGRRAPEPPAGLETYAWRPAVGEDGYWVRDSDLSS